MVIEQLLIAILLDRRAGFVHQPLVIGQVVDRKEGRTEHLVADKEVAQVTAAVAASDAGTFGVERPGVFAMDGVADLDRAGGSEGHRVATVACRHDAIEQVDTTGDRFEKVDGSADTHQVAWFIDGKFRGGCCGDAVHFGRGFPNAQSPNRKAIKPHRCEFTGALQPQRLVQAPLDDREFGLVIPLRRGEAPGRPADASLERVDDHFAAIGQFDDVIEHHRDVAAECLLDLDRVFRGQPDDRAIEVAFEGSGLFGDLVQIAEAEDLETAAVGEDRAVPEHHAVKAAEFFDDFVTGAEAKVIGVGEDHLRAGPDELIGRQSFDRGLCPHRHEGGGLDFAPGGTKRPSPRAGGPVGAAELERK